MTALNTQFGVLAESTYGTQAGAVTRFFETNGIPDFNAEIGRAQSEGLRSGTRVRRSDRFVPYNLGASGTVELDVPTKGFGVFLAPMLGAVATTGPTDSVYTHTATVGSLLGDILTCQVGRAFHPSGTMQAMTYEGGKVTSWELSTDVEGLLVASLDFDFEDCTTATGLATASYPASAAVFSWTGMTVTIGGAAMEASNFTVSCDNNLKTDRRYLRGSALKKEPVESGFRDLTFSLEMDFVDLTQYNRFVSATAAGAIAQIVATWTGPILAGSTTYPSVTVTIPAARFDAVDLSTGADPMTQTLSGIGMDNGSASPVTIAYASTDVTP